MQYIGFSESVAYVESQLREHAPIHGLCGFSQVSFSSRKALVLQHSHVEGDPSSSHD
jgi:Serine hydrolase (FSH1)